MAAVCVGLVTPSDFPLEIKLFASFVRTIVEKASKRVRERPKVRWYETAGEVVETGCEVVV